mgnify:CR=1 FL=1
MGKYLGRRPGGAPVEYRLNIAGSVARRRRNFFEIIRLENVISLGKTHFGIGFQLKVKIKTPKSVFDPQMDPKSGSPQNPN